jgi:hypothetical protein
LRKGLDSNLTLVSSLGEVGLNLRGGVFSGVGSPAEDGKVILAVNSLDCSDNFLGNVKGLVSFGLSRRRGGVQGGEVE